MSRNHSVWFVTKDIATKLDRVTYLRTSLKEFIIYLLFITNLIIFVNTRRDVSDYFYTRALVQGLIMRKFPFKPNLTNVKQITFLDINTMEQVWSFLENVLPVILYDDEIYDQYDNFVRFSKEDEQKFLFQNQLIGLPRIRMIRSKNGSCKVAQNFESVKSFSHSTCYNSANEDDIDTDSFGPNLEFRFTANNETNNPVIRTLFSNYPGGGYVQDLSIKRLRTIQKLHFLRQKHFVSRATRVLWLTFSFYNTNFNKIIHFNLRFEFPVIGLVMPGYRITLLSDTQTINHSYYILNLFLGGSLVLFILYNSFVEIRQLLYFEFKYFLLFWSHLNLFSIILFWFSMYFLFNYISETRESLKKDFGNEYINLEMADHNLRTFYIMNAAMLYLNYMQAFKYFNVSNTMGQFVTTIKNSLSDLLNFIFLFLVIYYSFTAVGFLLFGEFLLDYCTFGSSFFTLLRAILKDFNYHQIRGLHSFTAGVYFGAYIFFTIFVSLNIFLAIINEEYGKFKTYLSIAPDELEFSDYLKFLAYRTLNGCGFTIGRYDSKLRRVIRAQDFARDLDRWGFTREEIREFLMQYARTARGNKEFTIDEFLKFLLSAQDSQYGKNEDKKSQIKPKVYLKHEELLNVIDESIENCGDKVKQLCDILDHLKSVEKTSKK